MNFQRLKEIIENTPNKRSFLDPTSILYKDTFIIISALYSNDIYCEDVERASDIYDIVNRYQLDPQMLK